MSTRHKHLSKTQRRMLARITLTGTSEAALAAIGGVEHRRARRALIAAVMAHNGGLTINSPLPADVVIQYGEIVTAAGETVTGYCLSVDNQLIEEAIKARQAQRAVEARR